MTPKLIRENQLGLSALYQKDINALTMRQHSRKPATAGLCEDHILCTEQKAGHV